MPALIETDLSSSSTRSSSPDASLEALSLMSKTSPNAGDIELAIKILDIIFRYRLHRTNPLDSSTSDEVEGRLSFTCQIYKFVKAHKTIRMCLPAFPFKSPNSTNKVLGRLPDKGEEIALSRLNGLCQAIKDVYEPGATLVIISDGLVYNDLLGVSDRDVFAYGEGIRALCEAKTLENLEFSRLQDLVHLPNIPKKLDEVVYVANATNFRRALLNNYGKPSWDSSAQIAENEDVCLTYRGYIKFLATDLRHVYPVGESRSKTKYKSSIEYIAKQMLARGDAFARAVRDRFEGHIRLSIHPSVGASKIPISLLPTEGCFTTPWHSSVAIDVNGKTHSGHRESFEADPKYELVLQNGRPSFFRERSDLYDWGADRQIVVDPIFPCGLMIRPRASNKFKLTMADIPANKVRALAEFNSPVVLRGFEINGDKDAFVEKSHEFGTPLPWKFGLVLSVRDAGSESGGLNNVLSAEWMPFHFDGNFKTEKKTLADGSEALRPNPPKFQFFLGKTPSPKDTGFTLFTPSRLIFQNLPQETGLDQLRKLTWNVSTGAFDATKMSGLPLVETHPVTLEPCLRFHEPWPKEKTIFDATHVGIDDVDEAEGNRICETLAALCHDRRNCYYHAWEKGDLLVSDNVNMLHTRSDFRSGSPRELWRIHFD